MLRKGETGEKAKTESASFNMGTDLPKLWAATWELSGSGLHRKILTWCTLLVQIVLFARPSEVCEFCPLIEDIKLPSEELWDVDGMPQWVMLCLRDWKQRSRDKKGKF